MSLETIINQNGATNYGYRADTTVKSLETAAFKLPIGAVNGYVLTSDGSGNGTWTEVKNVSTTVATGTANQVLVNGVTSPQTGALLFTLPQSIGTTSVVTFDSATLTNGITLPNLNTSQYVVTNTSKQLANVSTIPISDITGITASVPLGYSAGNFSLSYSGTNLKLSTGALDTIQSIAVAASPTFVNVTFSSLTPNQYLKTTSGSALQSIASIPAADISGLVATVPITYSAGTIALNISTNLKITGSNLDTIQDIKTSSSPVFSSLLVGDVFSNSSYAGIRFNTLSTVSYLAMQDNTGNSFINCASTKTLSLRCNNTPILDLTTSGGANLTGALAATGDISSSSGNVTVRSGNKLKFGSGGNQFDYYGQIYQNLNTSYFECHGDTDLIAPRSGNFLVRTYNNPAGTIIPTDAFFVQYDGRCGILNTAPTYQLDVTGQGRIAPAASFTGNGTVASFYVAGSLTCNNTSNAMIGIYNTSTFTNTAGTSTCYGYYSANTFTATSTIANAYSMYLTSGSSTGTITNGTGLYVETPAFGTNKYTAIFTGGTPKVGIGLTNPAYTLDVVGNQQVTNAVEATGLVVKSGTVSRGGEIQMVNLKSGLSVPNKFMRVNSTGDFEILNSIYSAVVFVVTDAGNGAFPNGGLTVNQYLTVGSTITLQSLTGASYLKTDGGGVVSCNSATFTSDVRSQLSAGSGISYNSSTGVISTANTIASGSFTPTFSNLDVNVASVVNISCRYSQNGNIVEVWGAVTITDANPTSNPSSISFEMTLPVAKTLAATTDVVGAGENITDATTATLLNYKAVVLGVAAASRAKMVMVSTSSFATSEVRKFSFWYSYST